MDIDPPKYMRERKFILHGCKDHGNIQCAYDTVSDVVESNGQFASKILTPNRMD